MWETLSGQKVDPVVRGRGAGGSAAPPTGNNPLPTTIIAHGDNSASLSIVKSGKNGALRHMGRTFGVGLSALHEDLLSGQFSLGYITTDLMAADIFTMFFPASTRAIWDTVCGLFGVFPPEGWLKVLEREGYGHRAAV